LATSSPGAEKQFKIQMAKGKWQMENHLKFALCHLPFDLLEERGLSFCILITCPKGRRLRWPKGQR
jgi:hypothetical protein